MLYEYDDISTKYEELYNHRIISLTYSPRENREQIIRKPKNLFNPDFFTSKIYSIFNPEDIWYNSVIDWLRNYADHMYTHVDQLKFLTQKFNNIQGMTQ